jgi:hypothetical protein
MVNDESVLMNEGEPTPLGNDSPWRGHNIGVVITAWVRAMC